jgi:hypothetical protein
MMVTCDEMMKSHIWIPFCSTLITSLSTASHSHQGLDASRRVVQVATKSGLEGLTSSSFSTMLVKVIAMAGSSS